MTAARRSSYLVAGAFALCCAAFGARAEQTDLARNLLVDMARAARELNYDGVFVYQRGAHTDTMRIIHRGTPAGERERLVSLTGAAREVIRDDASVKCIFPDNRAVMVEKGRPRKLIASAFAGSVDEIAKQYRFVLHGPDRIAGRPTTVVGVVPNVADRYGYALWIDDATHLLLKSSVVDGAGNVLEQILFTEISYPESIPDKLLEPGVAGEGYTWFTGERGEDAGETDAAGERWQVQWLPNGFQLRKYSMQRMAASARPVRHMAFSDGLALISVFVEPIDAANPPMEGYSVMGAVNTYSLRTHEHQVTVVGEAPPLTVRRVAVSVVPAASP